MWAVVFDEQGRASRTVDTQPICGTDFCDDCGDCLDCYSEDACGAGGDHVWVVYANQAAAFDAAHPDGVEVD